MKERILAIVGGGWFKLVVDGAWIGAVVRDVDAAMESDRGPGGHTHAGVRIGKPNGHLSAAAIGPGKVRNGHKVLFRMLELALIIGGHRLGFALDDLNPVEQRGTKLGSE